MTNIIFRIIFWKLNGFYNELHKQRSLYLKKNIFFGGNNILNRIEISLKYKDTKNAFSSWLTLTDC